MRLIDNEEFISVLMYLNFEKESFTLEEIKTAVDEVTTYIDVGRGLEWKIRGGDALKLVRLESIDKIRELRYTALNEVIVAAQSALDGGSNKSIKVGIEYVKEVMAAEEAEEAGCAPD